MKYKVTVEYRGTYTTEVEAKSEEEADKLAVEESDGGLSGFLYVYGVDVEKIEEEE